MTTKERVVKAVTSLNRDERFNKIEFSDSLVQDTAITLRSHFKDYLDCLILASAIHSSQILLTEDKVIKEVAAVNKAIIDGINPDFQVCNWAQIKENY